MKTKRILSLLLSLSMMLGLISTSALAQTPDGDTSIAEQTSAAINESDTLPDACITVPNNATLFVGEKNGAHFVEFSEILPAVSIEEENSTSYYFELIDDNTYNYRISGENYITYGGTFKKTTDFDMDITEEQLMPDGKEKTTPDRDTASNSGHNVADIYLNINPEGCLKIAENDTYQIVSLRNWEAVDSTTSNYFIEPDYHYTVTDENGNPSDIVTVDENGLLTANENGMAIVLVTYDAMTLNFGTSDEFYGAIYPENTGVFVVCVGYEDSTIESGITLNEGKNATASKISGDYLDSEHDCIYYTGEQGEYTFTPVSEEVSVYVANPIVEDALSYDGFDEISKNADNSFTIPLCAGRNIVKLEKDGKCEYQVITAKNISITVNNGEDVCPGDAVNITFDTLCHPANKLAGVYNMSAAVLYTDVSGYEGQIIGSQSAQYDFANNTSAQTVSGILTENNFWGLITYEKDADLIIPADYAYDTFTLSGGAIYTSGWGDPYGSHRTISYETGKDVNFFADVRHGYLGILPDIEIPITATTSALTSISLDTENVNTSYFAGDRFDTSNLTVKANYEDGTIQTATNYTVSPEILTSDTESVSVSYRGMTAQIPVTVTAPKITAIEITAPPSKTMYSEGETFSPSGMVVSAVYENGTKQATTDYSYSPNRELAMTDTEMIISFTGENCTESIETASQPITVNAATSGGATIVPDTISVYFTLLGDDKHGTPSGSDDTHTRKNGNLDTWISKTQITLNRDSYVIDAIEKALSLNGIPYTRENNYIKQIKGLAEFDNGNYSGWMYTLNGKYPSLGIDEQKLANGAEIVFHYTDDYRNEKVTISSSSGSSKPKNQETVEDNSTQPEKPVFSENTYADVKSDDWHYSAVKYAYENNLMKGTQIGFEPESKMTRAMLVTVLWRMENEPISDYSIIYNDVIEEQWYTEAIRWAAGEEIILGIGENKFGTDAHITREQIATILYRYIQKKQLNLKTTTNKNIDDFTDSKNISEYAIPAMEWAVDFGLISGKTQATISPVDFATRAEVATMLMRFCEGILK